MFVEQSGGGYFAQVYGGGNSALESSLTPLSVPTAFSSFGYFNGGSGTNYSVLPGFTATFQVRAWSGAYATYDDALAAAQANMSVLVGKSLVFSNPTGFGTVANPAAPLSGLQSFSIAPVPEPSAAALLTLGGAGIICWRARRGKPGR